MSDVLVPTEGLWPGVYAVKADADIYCLPCARKLYGDHAVNYVVNPPWGGNELDPAWPCDREGNPLAAILASEEIIENQYCGNHATHDSGEASDGLLALGVGHVDKSSEPKLELIETTEGPGVRTFHEVVNGEDEGGDYREYDMRGYLDNLYGETCARCHCGLDQQAIVSPFGEYWCLDCVIIN